MSEAEKPIQALSLGMVCDVLSNKAWVAAIKRVMQRVSKLCEGYSSPVFNVNVAFQVAAKDFTPEFEGLRSGRFSRKQRALMVQVAIPEGEPKGDPDEEVRRLLYQSHRPRRGLRPDGGGHRRVRPPGRAPRHRGRDLTLSPSVLDYERRIVE